MAIDPLIEYLEKTFTEAYRKEIDQEENVWRTLPFFAATLALEINAVGPINVWLTKTHGTERYLALAILAIAGVATVASLFCIFMAVKKVTFVYVSSEPTFLNYANELRKYLTANNTSNRPADAITEETITTLKAYMIDQLAGATNNNRLITQRRALWRTRAGLQVIVSVLTMLVLIAVSVVGSEYGQPQSAQATASGTGHLAYGAANLGPRSQYGGSATGYDLGREGMADGQNDLGSSLDSLEGPKWLMTNEPPRQTLDRNQRARTARRK